MANIKIELENLKNTNLEPLYVELEKQYKVPAILIKAWERAFDDFNYSIVEKPSSRIELDSILLDIACRLDMDFTSIEERYRRYGTIKDIDFPTGNKSREIWSEIKRTLIKNNPWSEDSSLKEKYWGQEIRDLNGEDFDDKKSASETKDSVSDALAFKFPNFYSIPKAIASLKYLNYDKVDSRFKRDLDKLIKRKSDEDSPFTQKWYAHWYLSIELINQRADIFSYFLASFKETDKSTKSLAETFLKYKKQFLGNMAAGMSKDLLAALGKETGLPLEIVKSRVRVYMLKHKMPTNDYDIYSDMIVYKNLTGRECTHILDGYRKLNGPRGFGNSIYDKFRRVYFVPKCVTEDQLALLDEAANIKFTKEIDDELKEIISRKEEKRKVEEIKEQQKQKAAEKRKQKAIEKKEKEERESREREQKEKERKEYQEERKRKEAIIKAWEKVEARVADINANKDEQNTATEPVINISGRTIDNNIKFDSSLADFCNYMKIELFNNGSWQMSDYKEDNIIRLISDYLALCSAIPSNNQIAKNNEACIEVSSAKPVVSQSSLKEPDGKVKEVDELALVKLIKAHVNKDEESFKEQARTLVKDIYDIRKDETIDYILFSDRKEPEIANKPIEAEIKEPSFEKDYSRKCLNALTVYFIFGIVLLSCIFAYTVLN